MAPRLSDVVPAVGRGWLDTQPVISRFLVHARHDLLRSKHVLADLANVGSDAQPPWPMECALAYERRIADRKQLLKARKLIAPPAEKPFRLRLKHVDDILAEAARPRVPRPMLPLRKMIPVNTKRTEWAAAVFRRTDPDADPDADPTPKSRKPTISPRTADRPPYARGGLFFHPHKRFLFSAKQSDLDELLNEAKNSEEKAKKAMVDAARLADELRAEQDHAQTQEKLRKALETQIKELQVSSMPLHSCVALCL